MFNAFVEIPLKKRSTGVEVSRIGGKSWEEKVDNVRLSVRKGVQ